MHPKFTIRDEANALIACACSDAFEALISRIPALDLIRTPARELLSEDNVDRFLVTACRRLATLLELKESDPAKYDHQIKAYHKEYCRNWER